MENKNLQLSVCMYFNHSDVKQSPVHMFKHAQQMRTKRCIVFWARRTMQMFSRGKIEKM